jgi:hypothetical protein
MRTRRARSAFVRETFCLDAIPKHYYEDGITAVCEVLLDRNVSKSEFCRSIFLDSRLAFLSNFAQRQIAQLLGVAVSLVGHCKAQAEEARTAEVKRETGHPVFLNAENEQIIRDWLQRRTQSRNWPTLREVKEQIVAELE